MIHRIKLTPETLKFAEDEGKAIFKNSKKLTSQDTEKGKIANSIFGSYAQQAFIEGVDGRRVTEEEVPGFQYDVVCDNSRFKSYIGWADLELSSIPKTKEAMVEIKNIHPEKRNWASYYDTFLEYTMKCARKNQYDYFVGYATTVIDPNEFIADVELWVAVNTKALLDEHYCFRKTKFDKKMHYFVKASVENRNWGRVFI